MKKHRIPVEDILECSLCKSKSIKIALNNVKDNIGGMKSYSGNIMKCTDCYHAFLSPIILPSHLHLAYNDYHTHDKKNLTMSSSASRDMFSMFKEFFSYKYKRVVTIKGLLIQIISFLIPFSSFFLNRAVRFIEKPSKLNQLNLLDVGCGRGDFLLRSEHCGYNSMGIDFDPETVKIACSRGLNARVSEIQELPESKLYDAVTMSHVLEHVKDPILTLNNIFKRIKPGGYFYVATPNFNSAGRRVFKNNWRGCDVPRHMQFFSTETLRNALEKVGFNEVVQVYDLPQSKGIILSSLNLKYSDGKSYLDYIKSIKALIDNKFYSINRLEVAVFKCRKSFL